MKIVVLGGTGLLGKELERLDSQLECYGHVLDITDTTILYKKLDEIKPDVILHAAAVTNADEVNTFPGRVIMTNIIGTANVATWCIKNNCRLVYISTDYVYNGYDTNKIYGHKETDVVSPYNSYASSKYAGECAVQFVINSCIIRTSFGASKFPYEGAYKDVFVSKGYVDEIAPKILKVAKSFYTGIINIGSITTSVYSYAFKRNPLVKAYNHPGGRKLNFTLDTSVYEELFENK